MKTMFENTNGVMVPDSTVLRELNHGFHFGDPEVVTELFDEEWAGATGPINAAPCLEAIDDDPTINALLAAENL